MMTGRARERVSSQGLHAECEMNPSLGRSSRWHQRQRVRWAGPRAAALLVAIVLLAGCAITYEVDDRYLPPLSTQAMVERWPVAVGVYYAPQISGSYSKVAAAARVAMGAELISTFRWALNQMFAEVITLEALPPSQEHRARIAGIVALERVDAAGDWGIALYGPDGRVLDRWEVNGVGTMEIGAEPKIMPWGTFKALEIRDATASFMVKFAERPNVRKWLVGSGVVPGEAGPKYRPTGLVPPSNMGVTFGPAQGDWHWRYSKASEAEECIGPSLEALTPRLRVVGFDALRLALFPWLEQSVAPRSEEHFVRFLAQADIQRKFEELNLRYWIQSSGGTTTDIGKGPLVCGLGAPACFGITSGSRDSSFRVNVIDLKKVTSVARESVARHSDVVVPAFFIPVPILAPTEMAACQEMAELIHAVATGKPSKAQPHP